MALRNRELLTRNDDDDLQYLILCRVSTKALGATIAKHLSVIDHCHVRLSSLKAIRICTV